LWCRAASLLQTADKRDQKLSINNFWHRACFETCFLVAYMSTLQARYIFTHCLSYRGPIKQRYLIHLNLFDYSRAAAQPSTKQTTPSQLNSGQLEDHGRWINGQQWWIPNLKYLSILSKPSQFIWFSMQSSQSSLLQNYKHCENWRCGRNLVIRASSLSTENFPIFLCFGYFFPSSLSIYTLYPNPRHLCCQLPAIMHGFIFWPYALMITWSRPLKLVTRKRDCSGPQDIEMIQNTSQYFFHEPHWMK